MPLFGSARSTRILPWMIAGALLVALLIVIVLPVAAQKQESKTAMHFKDVLTQYQGQQTSLGTLKKVSSDYVTFEDEQSTTMVPLATVQSVRLVKDEESGSTRIEVRLLARE